MNISRRVVISTLVTAIALFAGMLFWPFILNNIIQPIALVAWILLRVMFLSIDQKYFWTAVILVVVIFLFRLLPHEQAESQLNSYPVGNATITNIGYWRILFIYHDQNVRDEKTLKLELAHLLTSLYASKQHAATKFDIYEALRKGENSHASTPSFFSFLGAIAGIGVVDKKVFPIASKNSPKMDPSMDGTGKS